MNCKEKPENHGEFECGVKVIHKEVVDQVRQDMPERQLVTQLSDFFSIFGDATRVSILWALSRSEMCVCDLCALLDMKQSAVSQQLKRLRQSRIIKNRRDGKVIYYSLDDNHIASVLDLGMRHTLEDKTKDKISNEKIPG